MYDKMIARTTVAITHLVNPPRPSVLLGYMFGLCLTNDILRDFSSTSWLYLVCSICDFERRSRFCQINTPCRPRCCQVKVGLKLGNQGRDLSVALESATEPQVHQPHRELGLGASLALARGTKETQGTTSLSICAQLKFPTI